MANFTVASWECRESGHNSTLINASNVDIECVKKYRHALIPEAQLNTVAPSLLLAKNNTHFVRYDFQTNSFVEEKRSSKRKGNFLCEPSGKLKSKLCSVHAAYLVNGNFSRVK